MANTYFQFKQFRVHQDKAAMKVSTDACIQGAIAARYWKNRQAGKILDIGSGTGLLSLMLAQELNQAKIIAMDIEEQAFLQTKENFAQSPWQERLTALHCPLQSFDSPTSFEAIICNPPFFHKHLNSTASDRNLARHDEGLSKAALAEHISNLLDKTGSCCLLYPASEWQAWTAAAATNNLFAAYILQIQPYPDKAPNRVIGFFSKKETTPPTPATITIYTGAGKAYTPAFIELMEQYYLHL
ncbi:MAG: methyltransferase domain-containing protein [Sphingobacteriales bacterium]|nr:MAG: methyltransferase domain-containing protein [Sphingobacteriales bacterium]